MRRNFCGSCRHHFTDRAEFHNHGCQVPSDSNSTMGDSIVTYGDGPTVDESQQEGNFDDFLVLVEPDDLHSESDILPNDELIVDGQSGSEIINNNSGYTVKSRNKYLLTSSSRTAVNRRFPTLKRELIDCSSNYSTSPNGIIESEKLTGNKPVTTDCSCDLNEKLKTLKNHMDERFNDLSRSMIEIDRKLDLILSDKNSSKGNEKWHFTIEKHSD